MSRSRIYFGVLLACSFPLMFGAFASTLPISRHGAISPDTMRSKKPLAPSLERYQTFVSTDKPIYKAGEIIYMRGVLLNANNEKPLSSGQPVNAMLQIKGPKGDVVSSAAVSVQDSVWSFTWTVPDGQSGGEYKILATYPWQSYPSAERKFDIRAYRAPRLNSQIKFLRDGYGPGDKVTATLDVKRAEGGIPTGAKVTVNARVDGVEINAAPSTVDGAGKCTVNFVLPARIARGEGTLALIIEDGGVVETASKTIPIVLQTVDLQMFPEGGDLVAGFKNRVYVQAFQPDGKPADLIARVVSTRNGRLNQTVAEFRTEHEGRGRFDFVPAAGVKYLLKVLRPSGIKTEYPLPEVKTRGAVVRADKDVYKKNNPITLHIGSTNKSVRVTVSRHESELGARTIHGVGRPGTLQAVSITPPVDAEGVLTLTVWDEQGIPLAERLIFREPERSFNISVKPDALSYAPGENAGVTVRATDAAGKPVEAVVGITVTDNSVLQMIEKREQAPRLPVMVFLEPEVKDLADANVYFDVKNPKAPQAVDLLLGTQGWRRFAMVNVEKFVQENGERGKRAIAFVPGMLPTSKSLLAGAAVGGGIGTQSGQLAALSSFDRNGWKAKGQAAHMPVLREAGARRAANEKEIGRADAPRDTNMLQAEPTVVDERKYTSGRDERHQKTSSTLPEGSPIPDGDFVLDAKQPQQQFKKQLARGNWFAPGAFIGGTVAFVREFSHTVRPNRQSNDRVDFAETLYWNAGVKTDPRTGEAKVHFGLNDSVTSFAVFADGFKKDGAIGSGTVELKSTKPFYAEAKCPLEVTAGDRILLPVTLVNSSLVALQHPLLNWVLNGTFKPQWGGWMDRSQILPGARIRTIQPITVGFTQGVKDFFLNVKAGKYEDKVTRQIKVAPSGFPIEKAFGGMLEPGKPIVLKITIEKNVVPQSIRSKAAIYPTPLANMTGALERMIQDPSGCFEQTSSTSYPLTMAQQYFLTHSGVDPSLVERSREKLDAGYEHLVSFWCPDRGYEWFGENPGHEALTAFGLLHFSDMARVKNVDKNMIATTRAWLLKQKDGHGGFLRNRRALHTWIEDKDCSNAYITWALLETGQSSDELKAEVNNVATAADASKNNYVVAIAANALELAHDTPHAKKLMDRLVAMQKEDGSVDGVTSSIVGSEGESLKVEGTAFATLAWLRDPEYAGNVAKSVKFLADSCKEGRYGSTQATVLALRAIVDYDKQQARAGAPGKVQITVDGQPVGDWVSFGESTQDAIKLPDISELLSPGQHTIELCMDGGKSMPYSIGVDYNTLTPASDKECKVDLAVSLAQSKVNEGATTEANVTVVNKTNQVVPNPIAIIGLPGGLEPRHDQLKELVKKRTIASYEVRGREVVFYWRALQKNEKVQVPLSLVAAVPGSYTGPASRAYLYYTDEHKHWIDGMHVEITAKK